MDVGAHVGYFSMLAGKLAGETGPVMCFEPEDTNFRHIRCVDRRESACIVLTLLYAITGRLKRWEFRHFLSQPFFIEFF